MLGARVGKHRAGSNRRKAGNQVPRRKVFIYLVEFMLISRAEWLLERTAVDSKHQCRTHRV